MKTYEEKYKKALEWMREVYPTLQGAAKEDAEYVFPELKESEDERIRQLLIRFVAYDMSDNYSDDFTPADCVAWLEKQGKNNMGISEATKKKLEDNLNKALEKETPESWDKFLDGQGVQKPWSEEDEDILNTIINHFKIDIECTDDDDIIKWLKSLKDRVQPQPKQEWNEEDEDILNTIINHFEIDLECTENDDIIRWLKSLRPQTTWKPSIEQLEALWCATEKYIESDNEQVRKLRSDVLESLYKDLQKLREE